MGSANFLTGPNHPEPGEFEMAAENHTMTAEEARQFLETCNDQVEAGLTLEMAGRILEANRIVAADNIAQRNARIAALRAGLARHCGA